MNKKLRVQEPAADYAAESLVEAKLFANGRSQAIRLPKQFRMPGDRVLIHREGRRLVIEPMDDVVCDANGWPIHLWDDLNQLGKEMTVTDWKAFDAAINHDPVPSPISPMDDVNWTTS